MRTLFGLLLVAAVLAGEAHASSFVTLEPLSTARKAPSIIELGTANSVEVLGAERADGERSNPVPGRSAPIVQSASIVRISPSIVAMGEPAIAMEKVAAIGDPKKRHGPEPLPVVIRGGVLGDAFTRAAPPTSMPLPSEPAKQEAANAPRSKPARDKPANRPEPEPVAPPPAPTPPSPPIRQPE